MRAGALAGLACGALLAGLLAGREEAPGAFDLGASQTGVVVYVLLAGAVGALLGVLMRSERRGVAAIVSSAVLLGLLWWIAWRLTLVLVLRGDEPSWAIDQAGPAFGELIADLLWGGLAGLAFVGLHARAPAAGTPAVQPPEPRRVVILGAGFAGVGAAQRLERLFSRDAGVEVTLVSHSNYLLFTPMLAEVASSALEAQHICAPVRASCPRTRFVKARVERIDCVAGTVGLRAGAGEHEALGYDQLVLALGAVPNYRGLPGMEQHSFALKTLHDATRLRNHVIDQLERADTELDDQERRRLLSFAIVGGGFAGTETVAELRDLVHSVLRYYPRVRAGELRFVLVHSRERILPEVSASLADYALRRLRERGIEFVLGTRVAGANEGALLLEGERDVPARTIVWTAGNQPNPLLATLPFEREDGAMVVDSELRVPGAAGVWAVGDCARILDRDSDSQPFPPTAQHALREGRVVADNVAAVLKGREPRPFHFRTVGTLVALGHRTAVAEIRGRRFSGLLAWLMWRGVYLGKLPGLEKKLRVLVDWTIDLLFPRDIVLTAAPAEPLGPSFSRDDSEPAGAPRAAGEVDQ